MKKKVYQKATMMKKKVYKKATMKVVSVECKTQLLAASSVGPAIMSGTNGNWIELQ